MEYWAPDHRRIIIEFLIGNVFTQSYHIYFFETNWAGFRACFICVTAWRFSFSFLPSRLIHDPKILVRHCHYVGSCFYWVYRRVLNHMLVLDQLEMIFSITDLPFGIHMEWHPKVLAVVDVGVNRLVLAVLGPARNLDLYSETWKNKWW